MALEDALIGGAAGMAVAGINNYWAEKRTAKDRAENYMYGEMAANAADKRTRALYNDFYSPEALLKQYQEAGLSPSLMFGGTPGQGGLSGAKGTGAAGPQTPFMPMSLVEAAQAAQLFAQADKTKAETKNINTDTEIKELQRVWDEWRNNLKSVEFKLVTMYFYDKDDPTKKTSLFELAEKAKTYDDFLKEIRDRDHNDEFNPYISTEEGQKTLRNIFLNANRLERDINVLQHEELDAQFQMQIIEKLKDGKFAEQNADTVLKQLKAAGEAADLTVEQKGAWNNIIETLKKKNETVADILIIVAMIFNNAASNWVHTNVGIKTDGTAR